MNRTRISAEVQRNTEAALRRIHGQGVPRPRVGLDLEKARAENAANCRTGPEKTGPAEPTGEGTG